MLVQIYALSPSTRSKRIAVSAETGFVPLTMVLISFGVSPESRAKSASEIAAFKMLFENRAWVDCPVRRPLLLTRYDISHDMLLSSTARIISCDNQPPQ